MTKTELLAVVQGKAGFVRVVSDQKAPDSIAGDVQEKRYAVIETLNSDGTKGLVNVFYLVDTITKEAWFYNTVPVSFDNQHKSVPQATLDALNAYCKANFTAYFLIPDRIDAENKWAVVEAYTLTTGKLVKSLKMVYKQGANPITHVDII